MKIFKYTLPYNSLKHNIKLPHNAHILSIQVSAWSRELFMWAVINEHETQMCTKKIVLVATGDEPPTESCEYITTLQFPDEHEVYHVFVIN